jgi:hypothetical protein
MMSSIVDMMCANKDYCRIVNKMDGMFKSLLIFKANVLASYSFISEIDPLFANYECKRSFVFCLILIVGSNN